MRRLLALIAFFAPFPAFAQPTPPTPMATDLRKAPVGVWAEYAATMGQMPPMKMKWSLVGREGKDHVVEMTMEGGMMASMGGSMVSQVLLAANPTSTTKPVKRIIMQMGQNDPMEMPANMPNMPTPKFEKPDPKKLVGTEEITVAAGKIKTQHYRDETPQMTIDMWVAADVYPLGIVRATSTPKAGASGPGGQPMPATNLELVARGNGAKASITKKAKPFDPAMMMGGGGAPPAKPAPQKAAPSAK